LISLALRKRPAFAAIAPWTACLGNKKSGFPVFRAVPRFPQCDCARGPLLGSINDGRSASRKADFAAVFTLRQRSRKFIRTEDRACLGQAGVGARRLNKLSAIRREEAAPGEACGVSFIIPIYNEEQSLATLLERLFALLQTLNHPAEIIAINDGSTDGSEELLRTAAAANSSLKVINFSRNYGQTAALMAGVELASGDIIVSMDADLQNDPDDIPMLLSKLSEGYDVVSGWRKNRNDAAISRNLVSRVANVLISHISGLHLKDYGCTLKAYRRDVIKGVRLYGEMHRFIPIYASWRGAKVTEMPVRHHARKFGHSKYGLERVFKVILDLIVVKFLDRYLVKPIYIFGGFAALSLAISAASFIYMLYLKFVVHWSMIATPLPLLTAMFFLVGSMSLLLGLLAEIMVRTYFESQQLTPYLIRSVINFEQPAVESRR
jgi:glycosyltransferase involved in cell wall biosynthesis